MKTNKMKIQTTKKIFTFIMMMFFGLTQFAFAQKKSQTQIWSCNCLSRDRGCGGLNKKDTKACRTACIVYCGVKVFDRKKMVNDIALTDPSHSATQSDFTPITILESNNSSKLFESKKSLLTLKDNSQTQFIPQMEWGSADAINSTSN